MKKKTVDYQAFNMESQDIEEFLFLFLETTNVLETFFHRQAREYIKSTKRTKYKKTQNVYNMHQRQNKKEGKQKGTHSLATEYQLIYKINSRHTAFIHVRPMY